MREEEKLARDVYQTLFDISGQPVFQNIASSEQAHMDAVKTLIDRYGLDDPVAGHEVGEFTDSELQELYDQLEEQGRESLADALRAGAAIEEIDILDLEELMAETEAADLLRVYGNLLRGSRNHRRAFVSTLQRVAGETYEPQYLASASYEGIIAGQVETGQGGQRGGGGRRGAPENGGKNGADPAAAARSNGGRRSGQGTDWGDCGR